MPALISLVHLTLHKSPTSRLVDHDGQSGGPFINPWWWWNVLSLASMYLFICSHFNAALSLQSPHCFLLPVTVMQIFNYWSPCKQSILSLAGFVLHFELNQHTHGPQLSDDEQVKPAFLYQRGSCHNAPLGPTTCKEVVAKGALRQVQVQVFSVQPSQTLTTGLLSLWSYRYVGSAHSLIAAGVIYPLLDPRGALEHPDTRVINASKQL